MLQQLLNEQRTLSVSEMNISMRDETMASTSAKTVADLF
jgi:hypothetical protein